MNGWISLHRKLLNSNIFNNEKLLKVFIYCLLKASHSDYEQIIGLQKVGVLPGQFVFGRKKAALELNMKESTVWKYMKLLEQVRSLELNSNNKFTLVTVVNWGEYQNSNELGDNKGTTEEQQSNTYNNYNNLNNKEEEEAPLEKILELLQKSEIVPPNKVNHFLRDDLSDVIDNFGFEQPEVVIEEAIKISARGNGRTWLFVYNKLDEWRKSGVKTVEDLEHLNTTKKKQRKADSYDYESLAKELEDE
ncbi:MULTISPECIES: DnaD domain protein [unclassified Sutcliffiella]|uniref:DnaD domain protein n=1 Tax=unclassified Sutcliffiella TaxID=2837532 RepID=UPI0030CB34DD